ncbi:MAG: hypothetical protein EOO85_26675, partial [Pedobacter sp.]
MIYNILGVGVSTFAAFFLFFYLMPSRDILGVFIVEGFTVIVSWNFISVPTFSWKLIQALHMRSSEERIDIALLAVSLENIGKEKKFDRIAGTLIAFACKEAIRNYNWQFPCVSLIPKTEIKTHYIKKYGMLDGGRQLYL